MTSELDVEAAPRADDATDAPAPAAGDERAARPPRRWLLGSAALLLAALLVAAVVLTLVQRHRTQQLDAERAARASAVNAAVQAFPTFGTFSWQTFDADVRKAEAFLTPAFRSQYEKLFAPAKEVVTQQKVTVTVAVRQAQAIDQDGTSRVRVLVFADQQTTKPTLQSPAITPLQFQVTLERQADGRWLASAVDPVQG